MATFNDWLLKAQALTLQEKSAVVSLHTALEQATTRGLTADLRLLRQSDILAITERIAESRKVKQHLDHLYVLVQQLEQRIDANVDIAEIKEHAQLLDKHLYGARQGWEQANSDLIVREEELRGAIAQAEVRFATIEAIPAQTVANTLQRAPLKRGSSAPAVSQRPFVRDIRPRALQLIEEEMEQLGGRTGRWDPQDHDRFYSFWLGARSQMDRHVFVKGIQDHFPLYTFGALLAHDEFVTRYNDLNERRKRYIKNWRANQTSNLNEVMNNLASDAQLAQSRAVKAAKTAREKEATKDRLQALKERRNMEYEDNLAIGLRRKRRLQEEARKAKLVLQRRAATASAKRAALAAEDTPDTRFGGFPDYESEAQKAIDAEARRRRVAEIKAMKKRHEEQIKAAAEWRKQQNECNRRTSFASRDELLAQNARRVQSASVQQVKRDPTRVLQQTAATKASKKALEDAKKRRTSGGTGLVKVTQGFDPFNPFLGGLAQPQWMQ